MQMRIRVTGFHSLFVVLLLCAVASTDDVGPLETPPARSGFVSVDGGRLFFEQVGQGPPMVMIHDGLLHRETWDSQMGPLGQRFLLVRYDRRGYGLSDPPESPYSCVDDLRAVIDSLGLERTWLMGCSAGGQLAIDFALSFPDRVEALVLVGPVVGGMGYTQHFMTRGGRVSVEDLRRLEQLRSYWFTDDPYTIAPGHIEARGKAARLMEAFPNNLDPQNTRMMRLRGNAVDSLGQIRVPTLILVGEHDLPDVHAHAGAIQAGIRGAKRILISGSGHLAHMEDPDAFNRAVLDFAWSLEFAEILESRGALSADSLYRTIRAVDPRATPFEEAWLNGIGYEYLQRGQVNEAIVLFSLNTSAFPDSWNVWDSLGEAYVNTGDQRTAVECYQKSLELNPDNENGRQQLAQMDRLIAEFRMETREVSLYSPGEGTGLHGPYLGQTPPGLDPVVFAPGLVSTRGGFEFSCTFSPDGGEFYFNRGPDIMVCRLTPEGWTAPEPASFSTPFLDHEAHITADGSRLFFGSGRPRQGAGSNPYGIWVMNRAGEGWAEPVFHGPGMYVTSTRSGDLFLTDISAGRGVLAWQKNLGDVFGAPRHFPDGGSPYRGAHPCVDWDEGFVLFDSYRPDSSRAESMDDFFVVFRQDDGRWGEPSLVNDISTPGSDMCASLSPDGQYLFYHAYRDIYWVSARILDAYRPPAASRGPTKAEE